MNKISIIPLIDLTSLNRDDTESSVLDLCTKAQTRLGDAAAVCVYPKFVKLVAEKLKKTSINIATVVNFPAGNAEIDDVMAQIKTALTNGATEIDMVFPYRAYIQGKKNMALEFVTQAKILCESPINLKVIIETGELIETHLIQSITRDVIQTGADFIKTSTGKTKLGATLEAVAIILKTIKEQSDYSVGLKISGGIRTVSQAESYIELVENIMGNDWIKPTTFRIGASKLLDEILSFENVP